MVCQISVRPDRTALVDDEDFDRLGPRGWRVITGYARKKFKCADGKRHWFGMHRLVIHAPAGVDVDHVNGDPFDNRRANLRLANDSLNAANRRLLTAVNTSGFRGVVFHRLLGKWQAGIKCRGRSIYLGVFASPEDAARAYDAAARRLFGEFARCNFTEVA